MRYGNERERTIHHFTVVGLVTWPLNSSKAGVDLVLIQTSLLLLCKSSCSYTNQLTFTWEKQRGLYQSKGTSSLACIHGQITKHTTVKWPIRQFCYLLNSQKEQNKGPGSLPNVSFMSTDQSKREWVPKRVITKKRNERRKRLRRDIDQKTLESQKR